MNRVVEKNECLFMKFPKSQYCSSACVLNDWKASSPPAGALPPSRPNQRTPNIITLESIRRLACAFIFTNLGRGALSKGLLDL